MRVKLYRKLHDENYDGNGDNFDYGDCDYSGDHDYYCDDNNDDDSYGSEK